MTRFWLLVGPGLTLSFCLVAPALFADEPPADKTDGKSSSIAPPTAKELADKRMKFMKRALGRYTVYVDEQKEPATVGDPCLRWTNPIGESDSGIIDGILAVYAHQGGRPAAIGQLFRLPSKIWINEFTITAQSDVTIRRADRVIWKPSEYVCKFTDLPHSPPPAATPALRLAQMRAIAADFSVIDYFGAKKTKENLRLLRQPVYRYSEKGTILDGALFIFVVATDPECCLLVEAYQDDKGSRYRYAIGPMTIFQLEASYKDRLVWSIEARQAAGADGRSYFAGGYTPEPGEDLPQ